MKNYELKISQFIDNELSVDEQQELFRFLSESHEAQQTLADYMEMKNEAKTFYAGMNAEMDNSKIVAARVFAQQKKEKKYRTMFYFSSAAAVLLAFLLLFNQSKHDPILTKYQKLQSEMIKLQEDYTVVLSKQIELVKLNNQLYSETEELKTTQLAIKTKPVKKVSKVQPPKINKQRKKPNYKNRNNYMASIPTFTITKDDFLGQQIIGN